MVKSSVTHEKSWLTSGKPFRATSTSDSLNLFFKPKIYKHLANISYLLCQLNQNFSVPVKRKFYLPNASVLSSLLTICEISWSWEKGMEQGRIFKKLFSNFSCFLYGLGILRTVLAAESYYSVSLPLYYIYTRTFLSLIPWFPR